MIDREFIKKLNDLGVLVTYEEKQTKINEDGSIEVNKAYNIRYRNRCDYCGNTFFDLVNINFTGGYAVPYILKDIKEMPISKIIEILKIVDEKVETINEEREKQCETR
jgi:hypothetical protein